VLSAAGVASRRAAEELIKAGRIAVNGRVVRELGTRADPHHDRITVDGEPIRSPPRRTIVLHKPRGVVSTLADPEKRPTVATLLTGVGERLYPVGRLDLQSTGLLLLTNDGTLAAGLLHPRNALLRTYHAKVRGAPSEEALTRLRRGIRLDDRRKTLPAKVRVLERLPTKTWLEIAVREGRWHLVRRMGEAVHHPVEKLTRVGLGPLALGDLPAGAWREVSPGELAALRVAAGLERARRAAPATARRGRRRPPRTRRPRPASSPPAEPRSAPSGPPAARPRPPRRGRGRPRS
jgi:pseudouridine synthase